MTRNILAVMAVMVALAAAAVATTRAIARPVAKNIVTVEASDYSFKAPDKVTAGTLTFRMKNRGKDLHHVWIVRLNDGKRLNDLLEEFKSGHAAPSWAVDMGGPGAAGPGGETSATISMSPGRYALICIIPASDGVPHIMKGMARELTVVAGSSKAEARPAADVVVDLIDYDFIFSRPLAAGAQRWLVRNPAAQTHEIVVFKLNEGATLADLLSWVEKGEGEPAGMPVGGTSGLAGGIENEVTLDLVPGRYALVCFVPDAKDGAPHFVHGMLREIEIR